MATQTTGGGSATSFTNTPQANDDTYNYLEDLLRANSSLYNVATNTISLDVMANDLGGNAKALFSVDDGDGNPITSDFDLLYKDVDGPLRLDRCTDRGTEFLRPIRLFDPPRQRHAQRSHRQDQHHRSQ